MKAVIKWIWHFRIITSFETFTISFYQKNTSGNFPIYFPFDIYHFIFPNIVAWKTNGSFLHNIVTGKIVWQKHFRAEYVFSVIVYVVCSKVFCPTFSCRFSCLILLLSPSLLSSELLRLLFLEEDKIIAMQLNTMMQMKCNQGETLYVILTNNVCGEYEDTSTILSWHRYYMCNGVYQNNTIRKTW